MMWENEFKVGDTVVVKEGSTFLPFGGRETIANIVEIHSNGSVTVEGPLDYNGRIVPQLTLLTEISHVPQNREALRQAWEDGAYAMYLSVRDSNPYM